MTMEPNDAGRDEFVRLGLSEPSPTVRFIVDAVRAMAPMNKIGVEAARLGAASRQTIPQREEVHEPALRGDAPTSSRRRGPKPWPA